MAVIGIVGTGNVGGALARRLVTLGHTVSAANSRGPQTLRQFELQTGSRAVTIEEAVRLADVVMIAIPLGAVRQLREQVGDALQGVPAVIDTGNYIPQRDGPIAEIDEGLAETQWVSDQLGVPVVKAFNSITADSLAHRRIARGARGRIALPVSSDVATKTAIAARLIDELGFDPYDAGPLSQSWRQQPGQPAYCVDASLAELPLLLARADLARGPGSRDKAMKLLAKLPPEFPPQVLVRVSRLAVGLDTLSPQSWIAALRLASTLIRAR